MWNRIRFPRRADRPRRRSKIPSSSNPRALNAAAIAVSALAAAAFSWVLGLWLAWDVLGETARHAFTFVVGGAASTLLFALHARWRILPILGPPGTAFGAGAAMVAGLSGAGLIVRFLLLYAAGAAAWWPVLACTVAFVIAALCIAIGLISAGALVTVLIRYLRDRDAPLGRLLPLVVGAVGGPVILAAFLYSPSGEYTTLWHLVKAPRRSVWYDARQQLFGNVLKGYRCDVLVVPLEAPVRSIDRTARDLIGRTLAAAIGDRTGLCVVDFDIARRALGEQRRAIAWDDVYRLADRVQARWIVRGTVSTVSNGTAVLLELASYSRDRTGSPWQPLSALQWSRVTISDAVPPELSYLRGMAGTPVELGFSASAGMTTAAIAPTRVLPETPEGLLADTGAPVDRAERLQLMASMLPKPAPEGESLWMRSIVALRAQPEDDPAARVLRARAWLYLNRRQHAESLVRGLETPEAHTVLELTRGNLGAASAAVRTSVSPVARLIDEIGVEWLRTAYGETLGYQQHRAELMNGHPAYAELLYQSLGSGDWGSGDGLAAIYSALARRGVDLGEPWTRAALRAACRVILRVDPFLFVPRDPAGTIERSFAPLWRNRAAAWRTPAHDRLAERDLYETLYALNREAAEQHLEMRADRQALPDVAVAEALWLAPELRSNPLVLSRTLRAARLLGGRHPGFADRNRNGAAVEFSKHILLAEDGETGTATRIAAMHGIDSPWEDEPPRPARAAGGWAAGASASSANPEQVIARHRRAALLAPTGFRHVAIVDAALRALGRGAEADQWLAANADRFDGDPARADFERVRIGQLADVKEQLARLRPRIDGAATNWGYYADAALAHLRLRQPTEARAAFLAWPGFRAPDASPVALAGADYLVAHTMMRTGETAFAKAAARASTERNTGAASEASAHALLAVADHDWSTARSYERQMSERYEDDQALARAAWLAFVHGDVEEGKKDALTALDRDAGMIAVRAFAAGARITEADPAAWIDEGTKNKRGRTEADEIPWWLAFDLYLVDRPIDDASVAQVLSRARTSAQSTGLFIQAYAAFRRRDWNAMLEALPRVYERKTGSSVAVPFGDVMPLPLYTLALTRSGRVADAKALAEESRERIGAGRYYRLTLAIIDEAEGRRAQAVDHLWQAFPDTALGHPDVLHPVHQMLEIAEFFYESTRDDRYRSVMADIAARYARSWPLSWAHGFVARYGKTAAVRRDAAVALLHLDPQSMRLRAMPKSEFEAASRAAAQGSQDRAEK